VVISDSVNHFTDVASLELKGKIKNVAFCPSRDKGDFLACVGLDGNVVLMQLISQGNTISLIMVKSTFLEENLWVLAWMPDGDLIATGGRGKKLFLLSSSQMTPTCKPVELEGSVWSIDFMPRTVSLQVGVRANAYSIAVGTSDCVATI
jgi:WD40 repeat protein